MVTTPVDLTPLLSQGVVGLMALLFISVAWTLYKHELSNSKREQQRADRLEEELRKLNDVVRNQTMQALLDATTAVREALDAVMATNPHGQHGQRNR